MSKQATIASLVRTAAKTEAEFMSTIESIFEEDEVDRIWEFFDRLNIPRSQGSEEELQAPLPDIAGPATITRERAGRSLGAASDAAAIGCAGC